MSIKCKVENAHVKMTRVDDDRTLVTPRIVCYTERAGIIHTFEVSAEVAEKFTEIPTLQKSEGGDYSLLQVPANHDATISETLEGAQSMNDEENYRYLQAGETIKVGDETYSDEKKWHRTGCAGCTIEDEDVDRYRRLNELDGHRPLKKGEEMRQGDKYWDHEACKWFLVPAAYWGNEVVAIAAKRPIERKYGFNEGRGYPMRLCLVDGELQMIDKTCDMRKYLRDYQKECGIADGEVMILVPRHSAMTNFERFEEMRKELKFTRALQGIG